MHAYVPENVFQERGLSVGLFVCMLTFAVTEPADKIKAGSDFGIFFTLCKLSFILLVLNL